MIRTFVHGKIHRARITGADLHYIGSITIDDNLLKASGILPFERVQVVDVTNGARLETYVIRGEPGSGTIQLNGAAAHLVNVGDLVIIMAYGQVENPPADYEPTVVFVDEHNLIERVQPLPACGLPGIPDGRMNSDDVPWWARARREWREWEEAPES